MSATVMMSSEFDQQLRMMCSDAVTQAVSNLAEKYSFDNDDAIRHLNLDDLKIARKRGPSPKKPDEKSVAKSKKEAKSKDDTEKPKVKRGPTGYLLYVASVRDEVKDEMAAVADEGEKVKPQAVVIKCAAKWKALEQSERDVWIKKAKTPEVTPEVSDADDSDE